MTKGFYSGPGLILMVRPGFAPALMAKEGPERAPGESEAGLHQSLSFPAPAPARLASVAGA